MTKKAIQEKVEEIKIYRKKIATSSQAARKFLTSTGIYTKAGSLKKAYR